MKVLFLNGVSDKQKSLDQTLKGNQLTVQCTGTSNVGDLLKTSSVNKLNAIIGFYEAPLSSENLENVDCIFNEIAEPDSHKKSLEKACEILRETHTPIINHPKHILETTRNKIYETLVHLDEQLIVPKTIRVVAGLNNLCDRVQEAGIQYPIIFRGCGSHGGVDTVLLHNAFELTEVSRTLVDGNEYYITEFYEYKDKLNLYTKCRLVVIDGEVYIRHWMHAKDWLVHARNRRREYDLLEKKKIQNFDVTVKGKIQPLITKIYNLVKLDYFGIDCHIDEKFNILLFELNATMNIFTSSGGSEHIAVSKLNDAIVEMVKRKDISYVCNE
jgi:glutathione synthase/RimK-type ligase-like ATP-grasp enzyme